MSQSFPEEFTDALTGQQPEEQQDQQPQEQQQELFYPDAQAWVQGWLLPHYRRNPQTHRWDPQWWRYEEVSTLLESLWETWEQMRWDGATGMIVFFRDYLWPVMEVITSDTGPWWQYNATRNREVPDTWPVETAPQGYFTHQQ